MDINQLPDDLPIPVNDGAADHLESMVFPETALTSTQQQNIILAETAGLIVLYIYPMTGRPDRPLPEGWDEIPGARGCTPQSCSFRDHHAELAALNVQVYGLSTQTTSEQIEARNRLHLPFELLSDDTLVIKDLLQLPTFEIAGMECYKRITLIIKNGVIVKTFYPVFPPDQNAEQVLVWLRDNI